LPRDIAGTCGKVTLNPAVKEEAEDSHFHIRDKLIILILIHNSFSGRVLPPPHDTFPHLLTTLRGKKKNKKIACPQARKATCREKE
jgi:hypothetical protein